MTRDMKPIPVSAAERVAKQYGYDQVIILGRVCHDSPGLHGEHLTTYGRNAEHCGAAAQIGDFLKFKVMGWELTSEAWQPIGTAPKDPEQAVILLWPRRRYDADMMPTGPIVGYGRAICTWDGGMWSEPEFLHAVGDWFGDDWEYADPTHWAPLLPSLPLIEGAGDV